MKFVKNYNGFIFEEVSKNEPIPEIIGIERGLAIFLIGAAGIGKSYFFSNHIQTKNSNIKYFSTDDVSLLYTKDTNVYYKGRETSGDYRTKNASELNLDKMSSFIETGQNFIYDTTGAGKEFTDRGYEHVTRIFDEAKLSRYKIIFIHLLSTLQISLEQDKLRDRHVDPHYIQWSYAKQQGGEIDGQKVEGNIQRYKELGPDAYYLVTSIDKKYKFYKFIDGKLAVRKNDRYVVKESKFYNNFLNESTDNNDVVDFIVDTMLDFIDEGEKISFYSASGNMGYNDYLEKNSNYQKFKPVLKAGNKIISKFNIVYVPKNNSYDGVVEIMDNMKSTIGRLGDDGWILYHFVTKSNKGDSYGETGKFNYVEFIFSKPDVILDDKEFELPDEDDLREAIENQGIHIQSIEIGDSETVVEFADYSDFDEIMNSETWYNERFETICDLFGFGSFDLQYRRSTVTFEY